MNVQTPKTLTQIHNDLKQLLVVIREDEEFTAAARDAGMIADRIRWINSDEHKAHVQFLEKIGTLMETLFFFGPEVCNWLESDCPKYKPNQRDNPHLQFITELIFQVDHKIKDGYGDVLLCANDFPI